MVDNKPTSTQFSRFSTFFPVYSSMLAHAEATQAPVNPGVAAAASTAAPVRKSKHKPCCICKMTKKLRDGCIRGNDDADDCVDFIEAHKICLRSKGFRA